MKVYLAGPLFTVAERSWLDLVKKTLEEKIPGLDVFMPYIECAKASEYKDIANICIHGVKCSNFVVAVMDGVQVDDGTAFECGLAYSLDKPIYGLRTDFRKAGDHNKVVINLMLHATAKIITNDMNVIAADILKLQFKQQLK